MIRHPLDYNTRKALCVHLGDNAGQELANVILELMRRVEQLERQKVDVIEIVPATKKPSTGPCKQTNAD
jgi:hypothetical protein